MNCPDCGAELHASDAFCSKCGAHALEVGTDRLAPPQRDSPRAARWREAYELPFRYQGVWYRRQYDHGVVSWSAQANHWVVPELRLLPFFMRRPRYTSLALPGMLTSLALLAFVIASSTAIAADADQIDALQRLDLGGNVSESEARLGDELFTATKVSQAIAYLASAAAFIWWLRRATCNLRAFGAAEQEFSPGWAIGWWFIPFASLVLPLRVILQAWRASDPSLSTYPGVSWKMKAGHPAIIGWWIIYQVSVAFWGAVSWGDDDPDMDAGDLAELRQFLLVTDIGMLVSAVGCIMVIVSISIRQTAANWRFEDIRSD